MYNYPLIKKVQREQAQKKRHRGKANSAEEAAEAANVALAEEEQYNPNLYYPRPTSETAFHLIHNPQWALDSGTSRHFTGTLSDFITLKRWSSE
jgi:hypothetical protein